MIRIISSSYTRPILQRSVRGLASISETSVDVHTHKLERPSKAPRPLKRESWVSSFMLIHKSHTNIFVSREA